MGGGDESVVLKGAADESELASSWHHVENSDQSEAQPQGSDVTTAALGETEAQPDQMTPPLTSPDAGVVSSTSLERGKKDAVLSKYGVKAAAEMAAAAMERARREAYRQACGKPDAQLPESQPDSVAPPLTSPNAEVVTPMSSEAGDSIRRSVEERAKAAVEYATQVAKVHDDRMREQEREQVQEKRNAELPETQPNQMTSPLMSETQGVTPLSSDEFWDGFEDRAVVLAELQKAITAGSVAASPEWCEWARAQVEIQAKRDAALPETQPNPVAQLLMPDAGVVPSVSSQEFWERSELGIKSIVDNAKKSDPPVDLAPIQEWRERVMRELEAREELETREDWEAIREAERDRDDWMGVAPPPQHAAAMLALAKSKARLAKKAADLASLRAEIQAYAPGAKLLPAGDKTKDDYVIPQKTVLLLVGDMGAGKSTLVNNIHRAVHDTRTDLDIAATASSSTGSHSLLLQEYTITPRLLVFDTRGLSVGNTGENVALLKDWVQHGVADSQAVIRSSDGRESREAIQDRVRGHQRAFRRRRVNFAIYVVNAAAVHRANAAAAVHGARAAAVQSARAAA